MKQEILTHLSDARQLENLYRGNKAAFKREFRALYPELEGSIIANFWNERLNYEQEEISWGTGRDLIIVLIASLLAGVLAKIPQIFSLDPEFFYTRNIGFLVFPILTAYFGWKNKLSSSKLILIAATSLAALIFINFLPDVKKSDTLILSCMHLLLFLWSLMGFAFVGQGGNNPKRLDYLKYNGDLVVMTGLILIAGGILTAITINLFLLIGLHIEEFYIQNIGTFGLAAAPIIGTYLVQTNPQLVGRVSPVIAKLFSPLVLVMLLVYLVAMAYSGKDPYNDRDFLIIFNALLIGVLAIIFFSVAETSKTSKATLECWVLFLLSIVTIVVNGIAISAILYRISEWGITPNRTAVLGAKLLVLLNLILVSFQLYRVVAKKAEISAVGQAIGFFLPIYAIWTVVVTFLFPFIFGFR
jgi:hypothetical protein